ncbi:MAG: NADH-quinone oxidoreductase subunit H [Phycisphaerales bacterium]|nr:NADH-quinone oxidoreductase subunit H [Phycisphaerales bacterium]
MPLPAPFDFLSAQLLVNAVVLFAMVHVILITVAYSVYLERRISAYIQDRLGPNRVGFDFGLPFLGFLKGMIGLGQPLADGIKFLVKEDYAGDRVDKALFTLAPIIVIVPAMIGFAVIPWGGVWNCPDISVPFTSYVIAGGPVLVAGASVNIGIVYLLAVASLGVYGVTLGGYASNNKFSFLGGLRATAQMISYEIPLGLSLLAALLIIGSLVPDAIVRHQVNNGWLILSQPIACVLFYIAALAESNRAPFDNAEAEQELVGGFHTEYSSMRFALFFLAEYSHLVTSAAFFTLIFLGGYHLPFIGLTSPESTGLLAVLVKFLVYFGKVVFLICFAIVVRWTVPRMRYDQVMMYAWQAVIPLALAVVVMTSFMVYFGKTALAPMMIANGGLFALLMVFQPLLPKYNPNRKLALYGSRFSPVGGEMVSTRPTAAMALEDRPVQGTVKA